MHNIPNPFIVLKTSYIDKSRFSIIENELKNNCISDSSSSEERNLFSSMLKQFLFNLIKANNDEKKLRYSRTYSMFCTGNKYYKIILRINGDVRPKNLKKAYNLFRAIADTLCLTGWTEQNIGRWYGSLQTEIWLSEKCKGYFNDLSNVIFQNDKERELVVMYKYTSQEKERIKFSNGNKTYISKCNFVRKLNIFYENCKITVKGKINITSYIDSLLSSLSKYARISPVKMILCSENVYDLEFELFDKSVRRAFSYSVFGKGGRYSAVWTNFPEALQEIIYLNHSNIPLIKLDFQSFNPSMCYSLIGQPNYGDPYRIDGIDRSIVKKMITRILSCENKQKAIGSINKEFKEFSKDKIIEIMSIIEEKHSAIKNRFFYKNNSAKLMNFESSILTDILDESIFKRGIFVLPFHDAILTSFEDANEVINIMKNSYIKNVMNYLSKNGIELKSEINPIIKYK
ncbi:MAG: hypothetical protein CDV28_1482 [Candidatus Electronema aureum]|uniref:Uncharacterized protein n=1 Tax=Candidatus Electronema aureum TaxID=2005002 RepID=A0A521FYW4_9BACT|nr:MAG: hypothetical protein CDV28_1482 [Candidatus Electronema aureum]